MIGAFATTAPVLRLAVALRWITSPVRICDSAMVIWSFATGLAVTLNDFVVRRPSASAVIVTAPTASAVTSPNRFTVAIRASEVRHAAVSPVRSLESACHPFTFCCAVRPA